MAYQLFGLPRPTAISANLALLPGAKVEFFLTGTTTQTPVYQDSGLSTPHTNPVIADSAGRLPPIYLDPTIVYKVEFRDSSDAEIYPAVDPANDQILSRSVIGGFLYPRTTAEIAAAVTPVNYAYDENDLLRLAVGNGVADDTIAVQYAINVAAQGSTREIYLHGKSYRLTSPLEINQQHLHIIGPGVLIIDHAGSAIKRATGGIAARCKFSGIRVLAADNAAIAFDMDQWQYCEFDHVFVGSNNGTSKFTRAFKISNVAYWNTMDSVEVEASTIAWDLNDANDNYFTKCRHVRFSGTATNTVLFSGGCSGTRWFGLSCENVYNSADVISFHSGCEANTFIGLRIEARTGSTSVLPIKFNGSSSNRILDAYILGAGIASITDTIGNNEVDYYTVSGRVRQFGAGTIVMPTAVGSPGGAAQVLYDTTANVFRGHAGGGSRNFAMTPALEAQDMNGNNLANVGNLVLTAAASNPGASKIALGNGTQTTVGAAGGASALPATPTKYLIVNEAGTQYVIPLYAQA